MDKAEVHRRFVALIETELDAARDSALRSFETATDSEHQARSKYETFSLETSYLARGQAQRVEELAATLESLHRLPLRPFSGTDPVAPGALVGLGGEGADERWVFLSPMGGGEEIDQDGKTVMLVTPGSPLGRAVTGRRTGERVTDLPGGSSARILEIR